MCPKEYLFWQSAVILALWYPVWRILETNSTSKGLSFTYFDSKNNFWKNGLTYWKIPLLEYSWEYKPIQKCPAHATFIKIDQTHCTMLYGNTVSSEYRCIHVLRVQGDRLSIHSSFSFVFPSHLQGGGGSGSIVAGYILLFWKAITTDSIIIHN